MEASTVQQGRLIQAPLSGPSVGYSRPIYAHRRSDTASGLTSDKVSEGRAFLDRITGSGDDDGNKKPRGNNFWRYVLLFGSAAAAVGTAVLAAGCVFDRSGVARPEDGDVSDADTDAGSDTGVDASRDAGLDGGPDAGDGGLPTIYSPTINSPVDGSLKDNDGILVKWNPPVDNSPSGLTFVDYEISWSDGTSTFTENTSYTNYPVNISRGNATYSIRVRARYRDNTTQEYVYSQSDQISIDTKNTVVARYEMLEGAGSLIGDSSGNGNHGVLVGCDPVTAWTQSGIMFDGQGCYVDLGNHHDIDYTKSYTIVVRRISRSGIDSTQGILAKEDDSNGYQGYFLGFRSSNELEFVLNSDVTTGNRIREYTSAVFDTTNVQMSLAATYDASAMVPNVSTGVKLYVDSVNQTTIILSNNLSANTSSTVSCKIGTALDSAYYAQGLIGGIVIFNDALDAAAIHDVYCYGKGLELHVTGDATQLDPGC